MAFNISNIEILINNHSLISICNFKGLCRLYGWYIDIQLLQLQLCRHEKLHDLGKFCQHIWFVGQSKKPQLDIKWQIYHPVYVNMDSMQNANPWNWQNFKLAACTTKVGGIRLAEFKPQKYYCLKVTGCLSIL